MSIFRNVYPLVIINDSFGVRSIHWNRSGSIPFIIDRVGFIHNAQRRIERGHNVAHIKERFSFVWTILYICDQQPNKTRKNASKSVFHALHFSFFSSAFPYYFRFVYHCQNVATFWERVLTISMIQLINRHISFVGAPSRSKVTYFVFFIFRFYLIFANVALTWRNYIDSWFDCFFFNSKINFFLKRRRSSIYIYMYSTKFYDICWYKLSFHF